MTCSFNLKYVNALFRWPLSAVSDCAVLPHCIVDGGRNSYIHLCRSSIHSALGERQLVITIVLIILLPCFTHPHLPAMPSSPHITNQQPLASAFITSSAPVHCHWRCTRVEELAVLVPTPHHTATATNHLHNQ